MCRSLHVTEVSPVVDLSGRVAELGAGHRVVDWEVLLGEVTESLEVNVNICPVTVNTRDLNVSPEIKEDYRFGQFEGIMACLKYLA